MGNSSGQQPAPGGEAAAERRAGLSLSVTLALSLGLLVLVAVAVVLAIGLWSGRANTLSLLGDKAELAVSSAIGQIEQHLGPAQDQAEFIAGLIADGALDPADKERFGASLRTALAAAPQVMALVFIDADHQLIGAERRGDGVRVYSADYSQDATIQAAVAGAREAEAAAWGAPVWRPRFEMTILNLRQPVRRQGTFLGLLVAVVSVAELSDYLAGLSTLIGNNAFILYDREQVLAHAQLIGLHSGPVTVGNIGAPGRMNYTIVGDTVNVGQRLEALCKAVYPAGTEIAALASAATAAAAGPEIALESAGHQPLPGRKESIEVFKLV